MNGLIKQILLYLAREVQRYRWEDSTTKFVHFGVRHRTSIGREVSVMLKTLTGKETKCSHTALRRFLYGWEACSTIRNMHLVSIPYFTERVTSMGDVYHVWGQWASVMPRTPLHRWPL